MTGAREIELRPLRGRQELHQVRRADLRHNALGA